MRVFVTGGTGAVGRHTIPALVQQGHTVTALARTPAKAAAALTAQGATAVLVSLFDRAALAAAFAGHDAVINLASAIPPMRRWMSAKVWRNNDRVRTEGSAAVVDAALAADVGLVVQESVSMLYRDQGAGWVDEDAPVDRYPMARGNLAAEANAHRFSAAAGRGSWSASGGSTGRAPPTASSCSRWPAATSAWCWGRLTAMCPRPDRCMTPHRRPLKERALLSGEQARRRRVVSGGGGFAGFHAARALSRLTGRPPRTLAEVAHDLVAAA
jgi:NAD(P)-dependent dehydrogenase (short-subunit alcohol dehydrogenase family)